MLVYLPLFAALLLHAQQPVNLVSPASPALAEPGVTLVTVTGSGYPAGSILPAQVNVRLAPAAPGAGPTVNTVATGVQTVVGSTRRVTFTVPASLVVPAPTEYRVSVSGTTADGSAAFTTNTPATLTIQPIPGILSSAPAAIQTGQTAALLIRVQFASFVQGAASITFTNPTGLTLTGPVIVVDNNTLLAPVQAASDATPGPRELVVRQGAATYRLPDGLIVQTTAASGPPATVIATLDEAANPDTGIPGVTTFSLNVTGLPAGALVPNQFRLFFAPRNDGSTVPTFTVTPSAISAPNGGNARTVTFQVPANFTFTAITEYLISFYGSTSNYGALSTGATFLSGNRTLVSLGPPPVEAPTITSVNPPSGRQGQTLSVTLTGRATNFVQGQTLAAFGPGISVGGAAVGQFGPVTVTSPTTATANIAIQPGAALGIRDVEVRTGSQVASLRGAFQVLPGSTLLTLANIQPNVAQPGSTINITGSGFPSGIIAANAVFITLTPQRTAAGPGRTLPATAVSTETPGTSNRQVTFLLPADLVFPQPENYAVIVSGSSTGGVTFSSANPLTLTIQPLPRLTTVVPNSGQRGQTLTVTITGEFTNFNTASLVNFGAGITVSSVTAASATQLTANLNIAANAALGPRNISVSGAGSLPNGFTVTAPPAPTITLGPTTTPPSARAGETVAVTASGFPSGEALPSQLSVLIEPSGARSGMGPVTVPASSVLDGGGGSRTIQFVIPAILAPATGSPAVNYLVSITGATSAGTAFSSTNKAALTVQPPLAQPTLTSVTPNQGARGQSLGITINGSNTSFAQGTTQVSFGAGITVANITVVSATALTAQISIAAAANPGPRNVTVTTGASQVVTLSAGFTVTPAAPQISSIVPAQAIQGQTVTATITGQNTNFASGVTTVTVSGAGVTVANVAVQNALNLTAQFTIAADAPIGPRSITVTTGTQILTTTFTINAAQPTITSVTPSSVPAGETRQLVITGLNTSFTSTSAVTFTGTGITVGSLAAGSSTSLTVQIAIAPDAAPGVRTLTVTTGTQVVTFPNFQVLPPVGGTAIISSVTPGVGATGSTIPVTILGEGTNFAAGTSVVSFSGFGISPGPLTVASPTRITTTLTIAPDATAGPRSVTVTTGTQTATLANAFTVIGPEVTILSPTDKSFVNTPSITVSGRVNDPNATVAVNGVAAPNVGGNFTVAIPLSEGNNTVTAVATTPSGATSSTSALVNLDTTPPRVAVLSPLDGDNTTEERINVAGNVNDIVVGTVNEVQAQVTVNGIAAEVSNRSFVARNVPLNPGANTIQVVARDRVGNAFTASVKVHRVMAPLLKLTVVSGNNQSARINTTLPQPLVVQLTDGLGIPRPNTPVFFRVASNNGRVGAPGNGALTVEVRTDAQGRAETSWTLGSRSGAGINRVEVGATGVTAPAVFTATGLPAAAARIVVDSGLNQTGAVGQKLPLPFVAVVIDEGNNRLGGVPVNVTVRGGGGRIDGQDSVTVNSDPDGRVALTLSLGPQEGNENNEVVFDFAGNTGNPAIFTASGRVPRRVEDTRVSGVVLDNANQPIPGVTVKLLKLNQGSASNLPQQMGPSGVSNANGYFEIPGAPVGVFKLLADGTTVPGAKKYPTLEFDITTVAGQNNTIGMPVYLPALDTQNQLCVDENNGGTLTLPDVPGFALTVAPGSATFPGGSKRGCVSVTPVNIDKVPMAPGFGQQPRFVVTIQPVGTQFNPPAALQIPNVDGLAPGAVTEMYSYDHDLAAFVSIGNGVVSSDGTHLRSVAGAGVLKAGWHCGGDPAPPDGVMADCGWCNLCQGNQCRHDDSNVPPEDPNDCLKLTCEGGNLKKEDNFDETPATFPSWITLWDKFVADAFGCGELFLDELISMEVTFLGPVPIPKSPALCARAFLLGIIASKLGNEVARVYGGDKNEGGLGDAVRHAAWSCLMCEEFGEAVGKKFGDSHEKAPNNNCRNYLMDKYNNEFGCSLAKDSSKTCIDKVIENRDKLRTIFPETWPPWLKN
jgi:hypothetical protein